MFSIRMSLIFFTWLNLVESFDNEDFLLLFCGADENNMEIIFQKCQRVIKDPVDGCIEKCFIEVRNKRAPQTRIDEKYYQFAICDNSIYKDEFLTCLQPCVQQLKVSYNGMNNINDYVNCLHDVVRKIENKIEHQDDPKIKQKPKPGSGTQGPKGKASNKKNKNVKGKQSRK